MPEITYFQVVCTCGCTEFSVFLAADKTLECRCLECNEFVEQPQIESMSALEEFDEG